MPAAAQVDCTGTTPIYDIQGATHVSPFANRVVETCGVVTANFFNGYYIQDPDGDGDERTSDGIFVLQFGSKPDVGTLVRVRDTVTEFIPGGAETGNLSTTNLTFPTVIASEPDHPVPDPVIIGRGGRVPPNKWVISKNEIDPPINLQDAGDALANPFNPGKDGIDFYESLEGMLVTVEDPVAVSAIRQFGTFSAEVFVLTNNGADIAPKKARTDRGGINLQPSRDNTGDQNPERVQIQFDGAPYPAIKVGDHLADVTGTVGYSFGNFEVNAIDTVIVTDGGVEQEIAEEPDANWLTVASYNVLNLAAVSSDDAQRTEIARQIADAMHGPDIIALQEIQDNNGTGSGVLDATQTLQSLADAITAAGGPIYDFFDVAPLVETTDANRDSDPDTFGGVSNGNIRNAFLYNPSRVQLIEFTGITRDVLADRGVTVNSAFDFSRDPLEAVFSFGGEQVIIVNNHFSSRFGSSPVFGGPQPFFQAAEGDREAQALAMNQLAEYHLDADKDVNVIILGDLNTFEFTDDLEQILPKASGGQALKNLIKKNEDDNRYSFIFEGNSQVLDHIFVSDALYKVTEFFDFVHVNNDFPRRFDDVVGSDHEPLLAAFDL
jgi:predicted extracellular nuclease